MNLFYDLPEDLQEKIQKYVHKLQLTCTFPFIQSKPNPYDTLIHKSFCEACYDRQDLKHFNDFLDYIHGKPYNLEPENRYMIMLDFLIN